MGIRMWFKFLILLNDFNEYDRFKNLFKNMFFSLSDQVDRVTDIGGNSKERPI